MSSVASFDELNILTAKAEELKQRSMPYELYFSEMKITNEQKEQRIEVSNNLEDMLLFVFALIGVMVQYNAVNMEYVEIQVRNRYLSVVKRYVDDEHIRSYADGFVRDIVQTTFDHIDEEYYLSMDRAMFVAENEANTSLNYADYVNALLDGKTKKQWISKRDKKVRKSHTRVDDKIIGIDKAFLVGDSFMLFPKDTSLGADASEIINCRCSVKYL